jgi:hypothetical protein
VQYAGGIRLRVATIYSGPFRDDVERYSAENGLLIMQQAIEAEIAFRLGCHGQQSNYRHGSQGFGQKTTGSRPAVRRDTRVAGTSRPKHHVARGNEAILFHSGVSECSKVTASGARSRSVMILIFHPFFFSR